MIPSILAREVRRGVEDYIGTTFPVTSPFFNGVLEEFLRRENGLFRGPFIFLGLPFSPGKGEGEFFPEVPLGYPPYLHQEKAFARMAHPRGRSTVIATGTGSGKTECFLWPVLDYCLKHRGRRGIKAIFIYPMNALASDQAQRTARAIWDNPELKERVTAGLYVGHDPEDALDQPVKAMERDKVITCRYTLRENPPDILLTNYKMLDFLLLRPADRELWRYNTPDTLKYLVVDELHTFDGAQGTDLSCLLRRLKSRLDIPSGHLCCVGTSATLGEKERASEVLGYAASVFGERFDADALVTEERLSAGEFLENDMAVRFDLPGPEASGGLDPESFDSPLDYLERQAFLWFGVEGRRKDGESGDEWRVRLGTLLRGHVFFQNFLKVLGGRPMEYSDLLGRLVKVAPRLGEGEDASYAPLVLDSLLSLVSHARKQEEGRLRPLVTVQVQGWLREVRRMVASVPSGEDRPELFFSDDLKADRLARSLPAVHCRDCGAMGWASSEEKGGSVELRDLKAFYSAFFSHSPKIRYLFPGEEGAEHRGLAGRTRKLCSSCMALSDVRDGEDCPFCGNAPLLPVFVPDSQFKKTYENGDNRVFSHNDCPFCGSSRGLSIFGARSTTLSSVMISQTMASRGNDDKKMLAFSDSVQDAAHHAGFFGARTYRFTLRTAMAKYLADGGEGKTLSGFAGELPRYWASRLSMEECVALFLAPDQAWRRDYARLKETGAPPGAEFMELLSKRLGWEAFTEFGLSAHIGRTLEKSGVAVASPDPALFGHSAALLAEALKNELPKMTPPEEREISFFLSGLIQRMKSKGAIHHPELEEYIRRGGEGYLLSKERKGWMPSYGKRTRRPLFLSAAADGDFDRLSFSESRNWYCRWMMKCFGENNPMMLSSAADFWRTVLGVLSSEPSGILRRLSWPRGRGSEDPVWALEPSALRMTCGVAEFRCSTCGASSFAGADGAEDWNGLPCLRDSCDGRLAESSISGEYYGRLYRTGDVCRLFPAEHTGMLPKGRRSLLEAAFKQREGRKPWDPNLLSCTPTLEMGIDIGDLSTLMLCSVPPDTASFRQRVGRAGRRDGNSLAFTVANGRPHDLYFFGEPLEMIVGDVEPPGVFLGASAVLERQFAAFCIDCWVRSGITAKDLPEKTSTVLNQLDSSEKNCFPHSFLKFIDRERSPLLDRFFALFGGEIADDVKRHIEKYASSPEDGLTFSLLEGLRRMQKQRASLQHKAKALRKALGKLKEDPAAKPEEVEALSREKRALERLFRDLGELPLFNLLTDEGLIPNYAFPESGVVLRSVIYRRLEDGKLESDIFKYERAAGAALRELAPSSTFYAGGRKVKIEQVDMSLSEVEEWRFCDVCSYMERVGAEERAGKCPRCGSSGFGDLGQRRKLLRMKQVYAFGDDKSTLIDDDSDEREPAFYVDQTLVNFDEKDVGKAWRSEDTETPFGFEYISRAVFREVNFGTDDEYGERVSIDGKELPRKGFLICRHCGKLQPEKGEQKHASICPARGKESEKNLVDCVYLYRELQSEALRILLPSSSTTANEQDIRSFTAALQLGFKKYFRGGTDHLRCTLYQEPVNGSELRRTYLLVYDAVPGGTGYLKQLALDSREFMEVLQKALDVLVSCGCEKDPERDGCYRCIYAYGASYYMKDVSRRRAAEMLMSALKHRDSMYPVDTVSHIEVNASFDSELEALFVEALRRAVRNEPEGEMFKQVINGKSGYFLRRGGVAWYLEPQVHLGKADGVAVPSIADFVFWPARSKDNIKPVVVFTDGYAFHRSRMGLDTAQRTALLRTGRFCVWSITWKDVQGYPANETKPVKDPLFSSSSPVSKMMMPKIAALDGSGTGFFGKAHEKGTMPLFLQSLFVPGEAALEAWRKYAFYRAMMCLSPKNLAAQAGSAALREALRSSFRAYLPEWAGEMLLEEDRISAAVDREAFTLCFSLDPARMGEEGEDALRLALSFDDRDETGEAEWRAFLRAMNFFQFIEGVSFFTFNGVAKSEYEGLRPSVDPAVPCGKAIAEQGEEDILWNEVFELLLDPEGLHGAFAELRREKWPAPVVGYEFRGDDGTVIAQAEIAWPLKKIALLSKNGMEDAPVFDAAGWGTLSIDEIRHGSASALFSMERRKKEVEHE